MFKMQGFLRFSFESPPIAEEAIALLNQFKRDCDQRAVPVFFSHSPYEQRCFRRCHAGIESLEALLKARLSIPMLDTPEEMTFPSDQIFDVEYHLNLAGKLRRSERVAQRLAQALHESHRTARVRCRTQRSTT